MRFEMSPAIRAEVIAFFHGCYWFGSVKVAK
jgi:hypothetical protein